ncbi:MAG: DHHA1 domain-containing protein, partial [Fischerella sp.]|nr:DHHA1 domain-containing protein [Fischerella sp.]
FNGLKVVVEIVSADMAELQKLGDYLAKKRALGCLMAPGEGKVLVVAFAFGDYDAREIIKEVGKYAKGSGGGRKELAQGAMEKLLSRDELASIIFSYLSRKG